MPKCYLKVQSLRIGGGICSVLSHHDSHSHVPAVCEAQAQNPDTHLSGSFGCPPAQMQRWPLAWLAAYFEFLPADPAADPRAQSLGSGLLGGKAGGEALG